jgi:predicted nucleic acid-binding protein
MLVYLDTNVFDNLYKRENEVTEEDESRLRTAIASGKLTIAVSHVNIREILAALLSKPEIIGPELGLVSSLVNWDYFIRFHSIILRDDIKHFAYNGERSNTPFEEERTVTRIRTRMRQVIDDLKSVKNLMAVVHEDREQKSTFRNGVKKAYAETESDVEDLRNKHEIPPFEQYLANGAEEFARAFARSFGVGDQCEWRGIDKLLKIPSVFIMTFAGMSFIYRAAVDKGSTRGSDSGDLHHAICAAAAGVKVFVTHDTKLAVLLERIPGKCFRVSRLRELLDEIYDNPLN